MEINHYKETLWTGKVVTLCGFSMVTACSQFWTYPCAKMLDVGRWFIIWKAPMLLRWFLILTLLLVLGRQLPLMLYNITEEINLYTIPNTLNRSHVYIRMSYGEEEMQNKTSVHEFWILTLTSTRCARFNKIRMWFIIFPYT